jgi:hypothetical protein
LIVIFERDEMKKILLLVGILLLSANVYARDVGDVKVADSVQLGNETLQLNGAGTRTKVIMDIYVAALYLGKKTNNAEEVLADTGAKRMALHMVYGMSSSKLQDAFKKGIEENHTAAELTALDAQLKKFYEIFGALSSVNKGDIILLDYLPGVGTKVIVNGTERGLVEGAEINRAILKIWLGNEPVQSDLKKDLLRG